jgi:pheromone shutdown protein TraB
MITIIGITHIENLKDQIGKILNSRHPQAICLELDEFRYKLLNNQLSDEEIKTYYDKAPRLYRVISWLKQKYQKEYKVDRAWDSKLVIKVAKEIQADIIPIDIDQIALYSEIEKNMTFSEKMRIFFSVLIESLSIKKNKEQDDKLETKFSKKYPTFKRFLIDKRDQYMSEKIRKNAVKYENIIIILGNAHIKGISVLIKELHPEIIDVNKLKNI